MHHGFTFSRPVSVARRGNRARPFHQRTKRAAVQRRNRDREPTPMPRQDWRETLRQILEQMERSP
jgi:hypothetical protein